MSRWRDTLFLHYEVDPDALQECLPPGLTVDTTGSPEKAYIGIVLLTEDGIRPGDGALPSFLGLSHEAMNVRTYVRDKRKSEPGIYFFSLDCTSTLATLGAKAIFGLPYTLAVMDRSSELVTEGGGSWQRHRFSGTRCGDPDASLDATFHVQTSKEQKRDQLSNFLCERYCLYHKLPDPWLGCPSKLLRGRIHHAPWDLSPVELRESVVDESLVDSVLPTGLRRSNGHRRSKPCAVHFGRTQAIRFSFFEEVQ